MYIAHFAKLVWRVSGTEVDLSIVSGASIARKTCAGTSFEMHFIQVRRDGAVSLALFVAFS